MKFKVLKGEKGRWVFVSQNNCSWISRISLALSLKLFVRNTEWCCLRLCCILEPVIVYDTLTYSMVQSP